MRVQEGRDRLQQYVYVFARPTRFVDEHGDKKHDVQCLYAGRMNLGIDTHLPNPFVWLRFFIELPFNKALEIIEFLETSDLWRKK